MDDSSDDEVRLLPFREVMWRVARRLNELDWNGILDATDDFAVVVSDWSGFCTAEDARNSLPPARLRLLQSRKMFFHAPTDEELATDRRRHQALDARLSRHSAQKQMAFWVEQIAKLAGGQPCLLADCGWTEAVALDRLAAFGPAAAGPLLDLASRLSEMPDREDGFPSIASETLTGVLSTVGELKPASPETERRLREMLATSCAANAGRETWTDTAFLLAYALASLFEGYNWPSRDMANVLTDADSYLSTPLGQKPYD